jgi:anti-sigma factor (TIGR02949 family)
MKNVDCMSCVDLLMEYLEGGLAPDLRTALDTHLGACPRCVAFMESYRATPRILREATAAEMPAELKESLLAALRSRRKEC